MSALTPEQLRSASAAEWFREVLEMPIQPWRSEILDMIERGGGRISPNTVFFSTPRGPCPWRQQIADLPTADTIAPDWAPRLTKGRMPR